MKRTLILLLFGIGVLFISCNGGADKTAPQSPVQDIEKIEVEESTAGMASSDTLPLVREHQRIDIAVKGKRGRKMVLHTEGMTLIVADTAMVHDGTYTATALTTEELNRLSSDRVNVTAGSGMGYRLLPNGKHFEPYAELRVSYDEEKLPFGYTAQDIYTSYYNERSHQWVRLERIDVDTVNKEIVSLTDHFTDFVNEVLKAPEMPETQAFVPTMMNEIKAASPALGVEFIQPPTPNNYGTANLSYPITIPSGRNGMQPDIALSYSSEGSQSWLGMGWDINIPSITVDTRWGVPRYDARLESEIYLLNGEQLLMQTQEGRIVDLPNRTTQWEPRDSIVSETHFVSRMADAHDSIIRHNTAPDSYWWEVVDRNGVHYHYGHRIHTGNTDGPCTLADDRGNIAKWMLTEVCDPNGNFVSYYYDTVQDVGIRGGMIKGRQIYITHIEYTKHYDIASNTVEPGHYHVYFYREDNHYDRSFSIPFQRMEGVDGQEIPTLINGRYGFKEVTSSLLSHIQVVFDSVILREYLFGMVCGSNNKPLLTDISMIANPGRLWLPDNDSSIMNNKGIIYRGNAHEGNVAQFEYYPKPFNDIFGEEFVLNREQDWNYSTDIIGNGLLGNPIESIAALLNATAIGTTKGSQMSVGGGIGIGIDVNHKWFSKDATAGGNYNYNYSNDKGTSTLIDINGDGYPDKVFKQNGQLYYRPYETIDLHHFRFGHPIYIANILDFSKSYSNSHSIGLEVSFLSDSLSASGSHSWSTNNTQIYFSDVNADGYPDLVTDEGVYFNQEGVNGRRSFKLPPHQSERGVIDTIYSSGSPCSYILYDGKINDSIYCTTYRFELDILRRNGSSLDTLIQSLQSDYPNFELDYYTDSLIHGHYIELDCESRYSRDGESDMADMEAVRVWVAPRDGTVTITDSIRMIPDIEHGSGRSKYQDGVCYTVQHDANVISSGRHLASISHDTIASLCGFLPPTRFLDTIQSANIHVHQGDIIFFRLKSGKNHNFDKVNWKQTIVYSNEPDSNDIYGKARNRFNSREDFVVSGSTPFTAPKNGNLRVKCAIETGNLVNGIHLNLYKNNQSTPVDTIVVTSNQVLNSVAFNNAHDIAVDSGDQFRIEIEVPSGQDAQPRQTTWSNIICSPHYAFSTSSSDITTTIDYHLPAHMNIGFDSDDWSMDSLDTYLRLFGPLYRGWGQFAYHNDDSRHSDYIELEHLRYYDESCDMSDSNQSSMSSVLDGITTEDFDIDILASEFAAHHAYNPNASTNSTWHAMDPDSYRQLWIGYGKSTMIKKDTMVNICPMELYADGETDYKTFDCPAPMPTESYPKVKTHIKQTKSQTWNVAANISPALNFSKSWTTTTIKSDFLDLNGDRYPDLVTDGGIQYTTPYGGISKKTLYDPTNGQSKARSHSLGTSFKMEGIEQDPKMVHIRNTKYYFCPTKPSVSGNEVVSYDSTTCTYIDVNGDGLPDRVYNNGTVSLNIGYRFLYPEPWETENCLRGKYKSSSVGVSVGGQSTPPFNLDNFSIGGGVNLGISENEAMARLIDIDGDGIPDKVTATDDRILVSYGCGNGGWSPEMGLDDIRKFSWGHSASEAVSVSTTIGFPLMGFKVETNAHLSPKGSSFGNEIITFMDMNGDGLVDYVTSYNQNEMKVRYNQGGKGYLLKKVTNAMGGSFELDYTFIKPTVEQPNCQWAFSKLRVLDTHQPHIVPDQVFTIQYKNGYYDRFERVSYGYDSVIVARISRSTDGTYTTPYSYTIQGFYNRSYYLRGRLKSESSNAALSNNTIGNRYVETLYDIRLEQDLPHQSVCPRIGRTSTDVILTNYYENSARARITTGKRYIYDRYHNIISYMNMGDTAVRNDGFVMNIVYHSGRQNNMHSLKHLITVYDSSQNAIVRKSVCFYDSRGNLDSNLVYSSSNVASKTRYTYDRYGNCIVLVGPGNHNNQHVEMRYRYDDYVHAFPVEVDNVSLGLSSFSTYDYARGVPEIVTDVSGQSIRYDYDFLDRPTKITAPKELAGGNVNDSSLWTWRAEFGTQYQIHVAEHPTNVIPRHPYVAYTWHFDPQHPSGDGIRTATICDGWGRIIQTKVDAIVAGQPTSIVSGTADIDEFGRTTQSYDPFVDRTTDIGTYSVPNGAARTRTSYDVMDREIACTTFHNHTPIISRKVYSIINSRTSRLMRVETVDPYNCSSFTFSDGRGLNVRNTDADHNTTVFEYDNLGQLRRSYDPESVPTTYSYDMLGRLTERIHPDAGRSSFFYDNAGNVILTTNAEGDTVRSSYFYNRLVSVQYPRYPQNDISYLYDSAGRVRRVTDGSGSQDLTYDEMGNVSSQLRTLAIPGVNTTISVKMDFEYDSWGRIQRIVYPDNEMVNYTYNSAGDLFSVHGDKNGLQYRYINSILYNEFGQRSLIEYGNATRAVYTYDDLHRLVRLRSYDRDNVKMQDIDYSFDNVGIITEIANTANRINGELGGAYSNTYSYDAINRLINAECSFGNGNHLEMQYSPNGRLLNKEQSFTGQNVEYYYCGDYQPHAVRRTFNSNDNTITTFNWDANGNLIQINSYPHAINTGKSRYLYWNETNSLQAVVDPQYYSYYAYDNSGTRTLKMTGSVSVVDVNAEFTQIQAVMDKITLYTSAYMVATNQGYTKHIYANEERICAKIGSGGFDDRHPMLICNDELQQSAQALFDNVRTSMETRDIADREECFIDGDREPVHEHLERPASRIMADIHIAPEDFLQKMHALCAPNDDAEEQFFYHSDHLGSASWITDGTGNAIQHIQYCPFGEPFVNEHASFASYSERFTFTGKERDEETGYSYFGARYYDADLLNGWMSVDPMADKYPSISPYAYCAWNPVKLVDLDGREIYLMGSNEDVCKALTMMNNWVKRIRFTIDQDGKIGIEGNPQRKLEKYLAQIVSDPSVTVKLSITNTEADESVYGGSFDGNAFSTEEKDHVNAFQTINLPSAESNDSFDPYTGRSIWHEITEAYYGGKNTLWTCNEAKPAYKDEYNEAYNDAHAAASAYFPATKYTIYENDGSGNPLIIDGEKVIKEQKYIK